MRSSVCRFCQSSRHNNPILAIETSFDNTAAAVVCSDGTVLSNQIFDQVKFHNVVGGTDPRFARNLHERHLPRSLTNVSNKSLIFNQLLQVAIKAEVSLKVEE